MFKAKHIIILIIILIIVPMLITNCNESTSEQTNKDEISQSLKDALDNKSDNVNLSANNVENMINTDDFSIDENSKVEPAATILSLQNDFREIAEKRIPAVVNIRSEIEVTGSSQDQNFYDFFRKYFGDQYGDNGGNNDGKPKTQQAAGSGFIISDDGYIITNNHVVENAVKVTVVLSDEREFEANIIGTDAKTDTALLKISSDKPLPTIPLGDSSKIRVGDIALAIGNPFGLSGTFTMGVISATGRDSAVDVDASFKDYIQTDAPINQGNSGGPLLNIYGEVVGMNTAIYSTSGGSIGIGFAIPINIVKDIAKDLADDGKIERPMLGLTVRDLNEDMAEIYGIKSNEGAFVNDVVKDSPADIAKILPEDVIIKIDGENIKSSSQVVRKVVSYDVGDTISVTLLRIKNQTDVERITVNVTLGLRDESAFENIQNTPDMDNQGNDEKESWMGMSLGNVKDYKSQFKIDEDINSGVVVLSVEKESAAAESGIVEGVIINRINGMEINSIEDLKEIKQSNSYLIRIIIDNRSVSILLKNNE